MVWAGNGLFTPVFDGLSAADGKLYLATEDRKSICLGASQ